MAEILDQLRIIIEQLITGLGYPGIGFIMFSENIFPPIPSELVMPFAGFLVAKQEMAFVPVVASGTIGALVGAVVLYYIGLWLDEPVIRTFVRRFGRFLMLSEDDLDRALDFFGRYGQAVVFFGRLIPIIRSLISIPAGMNRMPLGTFLLFTTLGATIWNIVLTVAGVFLGENWEQILDVIKQYQNLTLIVIVLAVLAFIVVRLRNRFMGKAAE